MFPVYLCLMDHCNNKAAQWILLPDKTIVWFCQDHRYQFEGLGWIELSPDEVAVLAIMES